MALVTLDEVKDAIAPGLGDDTRIAALIDPVSEYVERATGRHFTSAEQTDLLDGGGAWLPLSRYPVASIASVTDRILDGAVETYDLEAMTGRLYPAPGVRWWPSGARRWEVVYTGGFTTVPDDIKGACYELISAALIGQGGITEGRDGDYRFVLGAGVPERASEVLARYAVEGVRSIALQP